MKIVIATGIYPPDIGGPASFSWSMAREMQRCGHEVMVVCYGDEKTLLHEAWSVQVIHRSSNVLIRYLAYAWRVFQMAKNADVVFLQGPVSEGLPGTIGAWLGGKPTIMKIVGDYAWEIHQQSAKQPVLLDEFLNMKSNGKIEWLRKIERWTAKRARKIITPSRYLKSVVEKWGIESEKIEVIYNTIERMQVQSSRDELREGLSLGNKKVILTVVRAVPWKNGDFLCEVLSQLSEDFILVIVGDGPSLETWKKRAQDLGVESRVIFTGKLTREKVAEWYVAADIFVLPTGYEGFPHVVAEAASFGLPSLVSDKGGNPETKELFPKHVTVLPYLDVEAWQKELSNQIIRQEPAYSESFEKIAEYYLNTLKKICAS